MNNKIETLSQGKSPSGFNQPAKATVASKSKSNFLQVNPAPAANQFSPHKHNCSQKSGDQVSDGGDSYKDDFESSF